MRIDSMPMKTGVGEVAESLGGWLASWMMGGAVGAAVLLGLKLISVGLGA